MSAHAMQGTALSAGVFLRPACPECPAERLGPVYGARVHLLAANYGAVRSLHAQIGVRVDDLVVQDLHRLPHIDLLGIAHVDVGRF